VAWPDVTWDGLPVARDRPFAVAIVVWRGVPEEREREFLLLHRLAPGGPDFEGEWAWTPPAGARQPGETPDRAATRELTEETGLGIPLASVPEGSVSEDVALYVAEAPPDAQVVLDDEHDRFLWLRLERAVAKCLPTIVGDGLVNAAAWIVRSSEAT